MKSIALLLTAGGLVVSLPAFAQEGEISLYGNLHPFLDNFRTHDSTRPGLSPETGGASQVIADDYRGENLPNRFRITSGTSHIGFRADLRLSEHFWAFMQVESAVNTDGDHPVLTSPWASRNSAVGIKGTFGRLFYGNWDTPYKHPTLFLGPLRGLNPFDNTLTGNPGFNVPGTTTQNGRASSRSDAAFNRRQGNSVQYWTPKFFDALSARLAVSVNEGRTRANEIEPSISPIVFSGLASLELGQLAVHYAFERHWDYFGTNWVGGSPGATLTNENSTDDGHELLAWFTFPTQTRVAAIVERLIYRSEDEVDGAVDGYQRDAVYGAIQQDLGVIPALDDFAVWGAFGVADDGRCTRVGDQPCTTNGLNGLQWSVGATFSPAKTVDIYASYYEMRNGRSGTYALFPPVVPISPGSTTTAFGLGIMFLFDVTWKYGAKPEPTTPPPMKSDATPPPRPEAEPAPDESAKEPATEPAAPAAPEPAAPDTTEPAPP
jgi:predicted porin